MRAEKSPFFTAVRTLSSCRVSSVSAETGAVGMQLSLSVGSGCDVVSSVGILRRQPAVDRGPAG